MIVENKIYREWIVADTLAILLQIGVDPHAYADRLRRGSGEGAAFPRHRGEPATPGQYPPEAEADVSIAHNEVEEWTLRWMHEVFNRRMFGTLARVFAPNCQFHGPLMSELYGQAAVIHQTLGLVGSIPDAGFTAQHICSVPSEEGGHKVAVRWILEGHHLGYGILRIWASPRATAAGHGDQPLPREGRAGGGRMARLRRARAHGAGAARPDAGGNEAGERRGRLPRAPRGARALRPAAEDERRRSLRSTSSSSRGNGPPPPYRAVTCARPFLPFADAGAATAERELTASPVAPSLRADRGCGDACVPSGRRPAGRGAGGPARMRSIAAGQDRGPLNGIPFAVKDMVDVEGLPTTNGSRAMDRARRRGTPRQCVA
jgi:hypothetical protein